MRCVRPSPIVALRWCGLMTMFIRASARFGNQGAAWTTPITVTEVSSTRSCFPTIPESPPKRFRHHACVRTITGPPPAPGAAPEALPPPGGGEAPPRRHARPVVARPGEAAEDRRESHHFEEVAR